MILGNVLCNIVRPSRILFILGLSIYFDICFCFGVSSLVFLGLRSLIGLIGLSVGLVGLSICIFVCWWGLVFDGISYPCGLMITRYIGLLGLVVGFSFPFLF